MAVHAAIRMLSRGRFWLKDDRPSSIKEAQIIGREIEMSFSRCNLDELLLRVDALTLGITTGLDKIATIMSGMNFCCDVPYYFPEPDPVITNEGEPPENYGENPVSDWQEYLNYVCGVAKQWVQGMIAAQAELADIVSRGSFVVGAVALVLAALSSPAIGILLAVSWGTAAAIFTAILEFASGESIENARDFLIEAEDEIARRIVCAGDPVAAAIEVRAYLQANLNEAEYQAVRWFDIEGDMARIYAGVDKNGNPLNISPSSTCVCFDPDDNGGLPDVEGYSWVRVALGTPYLTSGNVAVGADAFTGNENNYDADRVIGSPAGQSMVGWDTLAWPDRCVGIGYKCGAISYVGTGEQKYGVTLNGTGSWVYGPLLPISSGNICYVKFESEAGLTPLGNAYLTGTYGNSEARSYLQKGAGMAIARNTATGHETHVMIESIRFHVQD
jgi:hypothetical protein